MTINFTDGKQTVKTFKCNETDISIEPDNRIEVVKTTTGAVIQDGWNGKKGSDAGDNIEATALFTLTGFVTLRNWCNNRTPLTITGDGFEAITGGHVVINSYSFSDKFPDYKSVRFTIIKA